MNPQNNSFESFQAIYLERIQRLLNEYLASSEKGAARLNEAMRYSVLNGGKRLRPLLVYATGLSLNAPLEALDSAALAVEFIHCYSLIHDDLPAMDNDDLRRGKPTCHKAFDEATAILAGDALQALAFQTVSVPNPFLKAETQLKMIQLLSYAGGARGMAAGQMLDIEAENKNLSLLELENIHSLKTGALISASIELGAIAAQNPNEALRQLGFELGLAFQIQDDILDIESSTAVLGKQQGADQALEKSTYPKIMGLDNAKLEFRKHYDVAFELLDRLEMGSSYLSGLMRHMLNREC